MKIWNTKTKYLFDLNGYIIIKNYFKIDFINNLLIDLKKIENCDSFPNGVCLGKPRTENSLYLSNIAEINDNFASIIADPGIVEFISKTTSGFYRFNHSYALTHNKYSSTHLHMGGFPIHPKATYICRNDQIFSSLTKAVIPLENHDVDDGCFCVVPGSHKSNFESEFNLGPAEKHPSILPLPAQPGDLILFTEALQHGGLCNISGNTRRTIFYCYSLGSMPDWSSLGLESSQYLHNHPDQKLRKIVKMKMGPIN